ncbi:MAG: Poxvirus G6 [Gammaproteobacteria bacterium]|nr:Poxvirus G6 [Gammaproteobacteria bacterium]
MKNALLRASALLTLMLSTAIYAGSNSAGVSPGDDCPAAIEFVGQRQFRADGETFIALAEQSLSYRAETLKVVNQLLTKLDAKQPLTGAELDLLNSGTLAHLELRAKLLAVAHQHECWLYATPQMLRTAGIDSRTRLEGVMRSYAAALLLYDNYLLAIAVLEQTPELRRLLNDADSGYGKARASLTAITASYASPRNRSRVERARQFLAEQQWLRDGWLSDPDIHYLNGLIEQSPSARQADSLSPLSGVGQTLRLFGVVGGDTLIGMKDEGVNLLSMLFGNAVGLVETRRGKLFGDETVAATVSDILQPGDILLEKTPFRLTDALIPGYFGHAAIWIGNEQDLRQLGLWEHPLVQPHHAAIRTGHGVVEALRAGVELNPLSQFLNIDDLAVIRGQQMDDAQRAKVVLQALRQLGKSYDFNFDIATTDRIVCSELVYVAYTDTHWPTDRALGRFTISPDQIARKLFEDNELQLVLLYLNGQPVNHEPVATLQPLIATKRS